MANPSITSFSAAGDGTVRNGSQATWAAAHDNASGTAAQYTNASNFGCYVGKNGASDWDCHRGFLAFDLSSIPAGSVVLSATLSVYASDKYDLLGSGGWNVVSGTQASTTTLATSDFSLVGSTEFATRKTFATTSTVAYTDFTLNASGLAHLQAAVGGTAKLALRTGRDIDNTTPGSTNYEGVLVYFSEQSGTSNDPKLTVTYTTARTTSDTWAWSDAVPLGDYTSGGHLVAVRTASDTWAWSDVAARQGAPSARTAIGSQVAVFTSNGVAGTFGAHYAFGCTVALPDGKTLMCIATKGDQHSSYNTSLVSKTSTDDGVTWSSESTVIDERPTWGWRDPIAVVLASGRIVITGGRPQDGGGYTVSTPPFIYSDDNGATWSTPVLLDSTATGTYRNTYGSDIVELANGDLLLVGYGQHSDGSNTYDVCVSKSTDDGATWSYLSTPALYSTYGYNCVEPQCEILSNGDLYLTFHTEDGTPTDWYRTRSQDSGVTWTTPVKVGSGDSFNRQGLSAFADDRVIVSAHQFSDFSFRYLESYNGNLFGSAVQVAANQPVASYSSNLWIMVTALGGTGESQNVGFTYGAEVGTQDKASVWWRQFTGTDGSAVYRRGVGDAWAWSDTVAKDVIRNRSTADAWAWSDTAAAPVARSLTTSDTWGWASPASGSVVPAGASRSTGDTWDWASPAAATRSTAGASGDTWTWSTPDVPASVTEGTSIVIHPQGMVPGTAIGAYLRWEWRGPVAAKLNAGPGAAVQETTVGSDLTVTFELSPGEYVAYAPTYPTKRLFFMVTE